MYQYFEIEVLPCDESNSTCKTAGLTPGVTLSDPTLEKAYLKVRGITINMNFVEAAGNTDDFDKPINQHINSNYQFSMDLFQE